MNGFITKKQTLLFLMRLNCDAIIYQIFLRFKKKSLFLSNYFPTYYHLRFSTNTTVNSCLMSLHNSNYQMNTWNNNNHLRYVAMQEYLFIFKKKIFQFNH
mgnify:FL=1